MKNKMSEIKQRNNYIFGLSDLALLITTACWGLNFVITKVAAGNDPEQFRIFIFNLIRFPIAALMLFITAYFKGEDMMIKWKYLRQIAMLSFIGIFVYQAFYMVGQTMTDAANLGIIYSFSPLLILLMGVLWKIDKPNIFTYAGVFLGVLGLIITAYKNGSFVVDTGSLLFFIAIICWAYYSAFSKPVLDKYPPVITTAWVMLFGSLFQLPFAIYQLPKQSWTVLSGMNIFYVIISAFLSLYTGYTLFYWAISKIGPTKAGIYTNLTPIFTLIFASLIRNETIPVIKIAGLAVIIIGIFLTKIRPGKVVAEA